MEDENNIDKVFKDRLTEDNPPFKEEYWQAFEQMLPAVPTMGVPGSASGVSKILSAITFTKGIIAIAILAVVSAITYYSLQTPSDNEPQGQNTLIIKDSSSSETLTNNTIDENLNNTDSIAEKNAVVPASKLSGNSLAGNQNNIIHKVLNESAYDKTIVTPEILTPPANNGSINSLQLSNMLNPATQENNSSGNQVQIPAIPSSETQANDQQQSEKQKTSLTLATDSVNYDSIVSAIGTGPVSKKSIAQSNEYKSKLGFYVIPGLAFYQTSGNTEGFNTKTKPAFQFGAGISYQINKSLSIITEVNALRINGFNLTKSSLKTDYLFYQWLNSTTIENREFVLMNIPLFFKYNYNRHAISAGPTFRFLLSCSGEKVLMDSTPYLTNYINSKADNYNEGYNKLQAGVAFEYSYVFYRQHAILIRYNYMFNEFGKTSYYEGLKKENLNMLLFAFRFRIY